MKTLKEIISQQPVFLHNWEDKFSVMVDFENIFLTKKDFNATSSPWPNDEYWQEEKTKAISSLALWENLNILFASYGYENYSGDAWVLFEKDGQLFEVNGSHCSCYGLENQWKAEPVILKELEKRILHGTFGSDSYSSGNEFRDELKKFLGINQ